MPPSSLVAVAGDQVVGGADCRGGFKRNRQCPEITEEYRGARTVGGGEQHRDIGPDYRPAYLDEFHQPIQGCGLVQADDDGQTDRRHAQIVEPSMIGATGSLFDFVLGLCRRRRLPPTPHVPGRIGASTLQWLDVIDDEPRARPRSPAGRRAGMDGLERSLGRRVPCDPAVGGAGAVAAYLRRGSGVSDRGAAL